MPHCVAFGCFTQAKGKKDDVSFHSFPKDKKRRAVWENACGRTQLPQDPRLCSRHFSPDEFESFIRPKLLKELTGASGNYRRLKPNAVPTIFPHKAPKPIRPASEKRREKHQRQEILEPLLASIQPVPSVTVFETSNMTQDTEEHVNPPARVLQSSVSLQFSPTMTDAATQTNDSTSDAAVQWPEDVADPVTMDHVHAGTQLYQQEEDCHSLHMFISDDESCEETEYRQSDPQYGATSCKFSESSQESQASTDTVAKDRVFLVFEKQLHQMLTHCLKCGAFLVKEDIKELQNEGSQLMLDLSCVNGCKFKWQSQPTLGGTEGAGNLLLATSVFFSGIHFDKFERFCHNMNLKTISEDTYSALRKKFVFPVIEKTWAKEQSALVTAMKSREAEAVLCGDGRCDSPGYSAKYCTYAFLDVQSQKVVDFKIISCNQVSSSNSMEVRGFQEALKSIEERGVKISTISTDRHPQIMKEMRVFHPEKCHEFDPWHVAKGLSKKLSAAAKRTDCESLAEWIPSIINHFWWSTQTCEGDAEVLKEKWVSIIHHITNRHDWPGNRHYHACAHDPIDEMSQRRKLWLRPGSEAHNALVHMVKDKRLLKDMDHLTKCIHTTAIEVYNSMYLKYLPKRTHFGYDAMLHASMLAALDHNNNANRNQAMYQDGESMGEPMFKIAWSKVHKRLRARPVSVERDYSYMMTMVDDVLSYLPDSSQMDMKVNKMHTMAPQERLSRSHIILETQKFSHLK